MKKISFLAILFFSFFTDCNANFFYLIDSDNHQIGKSYFFIYQKVRLVINSDSLSSDSFSIVSDNIQVNDLGNNYFSLFNNFKGRDSIKIILINKKNIRIDSINLPAVYCRIFFSTNSNSSSGFSILNPNITNSLRVSRDASFLNPINVKSFKIEILDTNGNLFYSKKIMTSLVPQNVLKDIKSKYNDKNQLIKFKDILMEDGEHLLYLSDYVGVWPKHEEEYHYEFVYLVYNLEKLQTLKLIKRKAKL